MPVQLKGARETKAWLLGRKKGLKRAIGVIADQASLAINELRAKTADYSIVYLAYQPKEYERTFALLESVGAVAISQNPPVAGVVINLTPEARAILPPGDVNYARFMLPAGYGSPAHSGNSFVDVATPRDFLAEWLRVFGEAVPNDVARAVNRELAA